jgi:regulator of CtrA degradation
MQIQTYNSQTSAPPKVVVMPSLLYDKAVDLLRKASDYFNEFGAEDRDTLEPHLQAIYACEMSRITLRLSSVIAWLMEQRSDGYGASKSSNDLNFQDICLVDSSLLHGILPDDVCYFLDESFEIYERALRLGMPRKTIQ